MANNKPFIVKSGLIPQTDNDQDLGGANNKFANAHISNLAGTVQIDSAYTLPTADGTAEQVIKTDGAGNLSFTTISTNFLGLTDVTPNSFTGQAGKVVSVNTAEDAVEFVDISTDFLGLTDVTPNSFTGQAGKVVVVNTAEDAVEFGDLSAVTFSDTAPGTPQAGDLWFDSGNTAELFIWTGSEWISATGGDQAAFTMRDFTGDGNTTAFDTNNPNNVSFFVYLNGILLKETNDYSVATGVITFVTAPALNDNIQVIIHGNAEYIDLSSYATVSYVDSQIQSQDNTDEITEGSTNLYYTDARVQTKLGNVSGDIIPDTNIAYDLGSATNRFRDLYLSGNSITLGTKQITQDNVPEVDLAIAPEVLEIQVDAPAAGQDTQWLWTWEQSTLPYARRTITNSPEIQVPLYKEGTYTVNNYAAYDIHGSMTQTHSLYFKWIDSAGIDNLVSWATDNPNNPISDSHPDINGGTATDVQRISVNVPATVTPPTLTAPSVSYTVTNNSSGAYTFSGSAAGDNPNLGPFYRGGTYTFNISATGHPLYLTTDNGTNFSSGTYFGEYTSGVTGSRTDSGTLTFVVPSDAPDTLYYQCGNHSVMRGAITVKDLAVETNINGNYVIYAMHTQEGHKTPVELRPIPSLVNQMCLVYDSSVNRFVPQDLATYVENTPSFENKIREVAGTAELVVEDGSAVIAKVNVYDDSTYLPLTGNNPGDQAFATDTDILYIWDGSAWQQAGASNSDDLTEGSTNLFYTSARANADFDTRIATKTTDDLTEGTNLYYTDARVDNKLASGSVGNIVTTGYIAGPATFTIDPAGIGDNTGVVVIAGDLQVDGTTTTINSTTIEVDDKNITLSTGSPNSSGSDGAGITVDNGSDIDATILYDGINDNWNFNKSLIVTDNNVGNPGGIIIKNTNTAAYSHGEVRIESENGAAYSTIFTDAQNSVLRLGYNTSGSTLNINASGHVGISTADPDNKLLVYGEGSGDGTYSSAAIGIGKNNGPKIVATQESADNDVQGLAIFTKSSGNFADPSTERVRIDNAGNIGLGVQSPTTKLDIGNSGTYTFAQIRGQAGNYSGIKLARGLGDWSTNGNNQFAIVVTDNGLEIGKYTALGNNSTGRSVFFQVDENGRVGINNNQPSARFEVGSNFQVNALSAPTNDRNTTNVIATFQKDADAFIRLASPDNTGNAGIEFYGAGDRGSIYGTSAYDIKVETNSQYGQADIILTTSPTQDNMRVGVGIDSPSEKLDVAGNVQAEDFKLVPISTDIVTSSGPNDMFVYDTRNDSDGGQWRKRTRNTSWYNESSSSTRSSRNEFPAVAILMVNGDGLFIYDGDDPDCPLWMHFEKNGSVGSDGNMVQYQNNQNPRCVEALNGVICVGGSFFVKIDFVADKARLHADGSGMWEYKGNISERNNQSGFWNEGNDTSKYIYHNTVHDVSMIVNDESPIDPDTKLPIPLIGIANELALCIIHPSEEVTQRLESYAPSMRTRKFVWTGNGTEYAYNHSWGGGLPGHDSRYVLVDSGHTYDKTQLAYGRNYQTWEHFLDDTNWNNAYLQYLGLKGDSTGGLIDISAERDGTAIAGEYGLTKIHKDARAVAYITDKYNTGWQHEGIRFTVGADTTDATEPMIFSDVFDNSDNWSHADGTSISGGVLNIPNQSSARATNVNWGGGTNEDYVVVFRISANTSGTFTLDDDGAGAGVGGTTNYTAIPSGFVGYWTARFTRSASSRFRIIRTSGGPITVDGMWVSRVNDRYQRYENHAGVVGTVPRDPVATGSELIGYNCQSSNNFMVVPYQSSLNGFGSQWYFSTWVSRTTTTTWDAIFSLNSQSATHGDGIFWYSGNALRVQGRSGGGNTFSQHSLDSFSGWQKIDIVSNGHDVSVYRNGRFHETDDYAPSLDLPNNEWYYGLGAEPTTNGYIAVNGRGKKMALTKLCVGSSGIPSAEMIQFMYENEKYMFEENASCTLYGNSAYVNEITYDDGTELLHTGNSQGRSSFRGLTRVENSTTNIGGALAARNGLIVED